MLVLLFLLRWNYIYDGNSKKLNLPIGVYNVEIRGGNGGGSRGGYVGGNGALVKASMRILSPTTALTIYVGGNADWDVGGFNGGGNGYYSDNPIEMGGGGGGASDIRINRGTKRDRVLVAGGGSGAIENTNGAPGGDLCSRVVQFNIVSVGTVCMGSGVNPNGEGSNGESGNAGGGGGYIGGPITNGCAESGTSFAYGMIDYGQVYFENIRYYINTPGDPFINIELNFACLPNCQICNDVVHCTKCLNGYFLLEGTSCVSNCGGGYYQKEQECLKCPEKCSSCKEENNNKKCTVCEQGSYLYNDQCIDKCPDSYYGSNGVCVSCGTNCLTCSSTTECKTCKNGYYSNLNHQCVTDCGEGFYSNEIDKRCDRCKYQCSKCSNDLDCLSCYSPYNLYNNECYEKCPSGYYGSNIRKCESCIVHCATCFDGISCHECKEGFHLSNESKCVPPTLKFSHQSDFKQSTSFTILHLCILICFLTE